MKSLIKKIRKKLSGQPAEYSSPEKFFRQVYKNNLWHGKESRSGTGSEGVFAEQKIELLENLIQEYEITSLLDLGCGDFYWMKKITPLLTRYHGVDVVPFVIENNLRSFSKENITFQCLDLSQKADQQQLVSNNFDLVVCFDVIGHMLNEEINSFLEYLLSTLNVKYLLLTNRIDENSENYLARPKSRHEGINIQKHPLILAKHLEPIKSFKAQYPGDHFELYQINDI